MIEKNSSLTKYYSITSKLTFFLNLLRSPFTKKEHSFAVHCFSEGLQLY